jgi:pyruvate dehydrogenase complex dehydrogenase (E1) component
MLLAQQQEGTIQKQEANIQEKEATIQEMGDTIQEQEEFIAAQDTALNNFIKAIKMLQALSFDGREHLLQRFKECMDLQQKP